MFFFKVHLTQLRGANAEGGQNKEICTLTDQLQAARTSLAAANATKDKIIQESFYILFQKCFVLTALKKLIINAIEQIELGT